MHNKEKLRNIKIVVSDLDGTLLNSRGQAGSETRKLIEKLAEVDVKFTVASARMYTAIKPVANELEVTLPVICLDGALIKNPSNGNILFESFIKEKYVKKAINLADDFLLKVALCHDDAIYYTEYNASISSLLEKYGAEFSEVHSYKGFYDKALEVVIAGENDESIKKVRDKMDFPYSFGLNTFYYKSQSKKGIYYLEIKRKGSSKGKGFLRLLQSLKIKPDNAAVIGDWYNDISMFSTNAFKVAMKNGVPELRRLANFITERTNDEDGVAQFLEELLKAKKG